MTRRSEPSAFAVLGIVLLVFGGVGFVYGQVTLQDQTDGVDGDGSMLDVSVGGEGDGGSGQVNEIRVIRLLGLTLGAVGTVMVLTGSMSGGRRDTLR